jgi:hypothetical protein
LLRREDAWKFTGASELFTASIIRAIIVMMMETTIITNMEKEKLNTAPLFDTHKPWYSHC